MRYNVPNEPRRLLLALIATISIYQSSVMAAEDPRATSFRTSAVSAKVQRIESTANLNDLATGPSEGDWPGPCRISDRSIGRGRST
jgi:hypothetical protein